MYKYDVFISYSWSEKNRTLVDDLYNYLSQNGVVPWKVDAGRFNYCLLLLKDNLKTTLMGS